jgi:hypothetical protein
VVGQGLVFAGSPMVRRSFDWLPFSGDSIRTVNDSGWTTHEEPG